MKEREGKGSEEVWGQRGWRTYANNALGSNQLDELVGNAALGVALGVCLEVAQVADVTLLVPGSTVGLVEGVDCAVMNKLAISFSFFIHVSIRHLFGV